jgi:hypothetical protein
MKRDDGSVLCRLTETICILHPILAIGCIYCSRIAVDVVETHVGSVHNVDTPQLGILDVEIFNTDIGYIPKHKRHWSSGFCIAFLCSVPFIPISINATSTISINSDILTRDNKPGGVVLECDGV